MTKTIHGFNYHQLVPANQAISVQKFAQATSLDPKIIATLSIQEQQEGGVIYQYKTGKITTSAFRVNLNKVLQNNGGKHLDDNAFDECWNAMCAVEPDSLAKIQDLQAQHKFCIHILGNTNEIQHNYIQEKIQGTQPALEASYTLSFEKGTINKDELKKHVEESTDFSSSELIWHTDVEQSALEILGQFYAPNSDTPC